MSENIELLQNLKAVQNHCILIAEEIDSVCRRNNIQYSLTGGSAIGAYLYNGFIPWDDDIDVMMTRDNYDRFLEVCGELPGRFSVKNFENGKDRNVLFSKVVDECTTAVERKADGTEVVSGIFVDITVFDNFPTGKIKRSYWSFLSKLVQRCVSTESVDDRGIEALLKKDQRMVCPKKSGQILWLCKKSVYKPNDGEPFGR